MRAGAGRPSALRTSALVRLGELTNRTFVLPLVVFFPTSRCNSRCVSCDWWKSSGAGDLTLEEIQSVADALSDLGTRLVLFSGGEPLLRPEVFEAAAIFRALGLTLHLHTSGVLLERLAPEVARSFSRVIVSLDASTESLYHAVRGVNALGVVEKGVARLRRIAPDIPVTARSTLHRLNFREVSRLIEHARAMSLDGISFLSADVSSLAFGRNAPPNSTPLVLTLEEVEEFENVIEEAIARFGQAFESGFVAESPDKLRRLPQYYAALHGRTKFPEASCNAPYVSVVIEADGAVRPCFFHDVVGSVRLEPLASIVRRNLPSFRALLNVADNPVCARCVCSTKTSWRSAPWQ
jgi:MoaA/NifB/PqqE/SkfB family radical SAM enzyme